MSKSIMLAVSDEATKIPLERILDVVLPGEEIGDMPDTPVPAFPAADEDDLVRLVWNPARGHGPNAEFSKGTGPQRNLIIEGDNWDALRWLRMTHCGKVRYILIDPPYNTGSASFS